MDTSTRAEWDRRAYEIARQYLGNLVGVTPEALDEQLSWPEDRGRPGSLAGIYEQLLEAAVTPGMMPNVIRNAIGGIGNLEGVLFGFEPAAVVREYGRDWEKVLATIKEQLQPSGKIRQSSRALWPRFCQTITSSARFLIEFDNADDFYGWVDLFDKDDRARPALPMLLGREIIGFGFPVACDFLKDLGYSGYGKPDVHIKKTFTALELSPTEDDYQVFKAIVRVANNVRKTPYEIDQLFWLIGSGDFSVDGIKVGGHRAEFIDYAKKRLPPDYSFVQT